MHKISKYFRGVGEEARRIRWPDKRTLGLSVAKVLAIAIVAALVMLLSDYLVGEILKAVGEAFPETSAATSTSGADTSASAAEAIRSLLGGR